MTPERVAEYPRPPSLEWCGRAVEIVFAGQVVARANGAWAVKETFHPPSYYIDPAAFSPGILVPGSARGSICEWKGRARYWSVVAGGRVAENAAWSYPDPTPAFADIAECVALYAGMMDRCTLDGEVVTPQPGGFYGGWITSELVGPFKGAPGTEWW